MRAGGRGDLTRLVRQSGNRGFDFGEAGFQPRRHIAQRRLVGRIRHGGDQLKTFVDQFRERVGWSVTLIAEQAEIIVRGNRNAFEADVTVRKEVKTQVLRSYGRA